MELELVLEKLAYCKEISKESTCNHLQAASALILADGSEGYGINGSTTNPCKNNGDNYCKRHTGDPKSPIEEYQICDSLCSEGYAIRRAEEDGKTLESSTLISLLSPCERCTLLLIERGVQAIYFHQFKEGEPRDIDLVYIDAMMMNGIDVFQNVEQVTDNESIPLLQRPYVRDIHRISAALLLKRPINKEIIKTIYEKPL